jgi:hypothetical protein
MLSWRADCFLRPEHGLIDDLVGKFDLGHDASRMIEK